MKNHHKNQQVLRRGIPSCVSAGLLLACIAMGAWANPHGGQVAAGAAAIDYGTTTTITQATDKAIINWQGFSIGQGETTQFKQPSANSVTLNRVIGGNPSAILGHLKANGKIFLINQNGIVFGAGSKVNVGSLIATTANITDSDFMAGKYHFMDAPAGSYVENHGLITVAESGLAALVAPNVINSGVIQAQLGNIVLASGNQFTIDLYGDGLISFDAGVLIENGMINNLGTLQAHGGQVLLTMQAAHSIVENLINLDGYIDATSVSNQNGKVVLQGYEHSQVKLAGTINVSGDDPGESGGVVTVKADWIDMLSHGAINASALYSGDGGEVLLYANNRLDFAGSIYAQGGESSGDGGFIETSAAQDAYFTGGTISAGALNGKSGLWLIDPVNLTVTDVLAGMYSDTLNGTPGNPAADVTAIADNDITFENSGVPIAWATDKIFNAVAGNDIIFNTGAPADTVINMTGGGTVNLRADSDSSGVGTVTVNNGVITASGSNAPVNVYYNPADFSTPVNYSALATGNTVLTSYMLVHDNIAGRELSDINLNLTTRAQTYALSQNISSNLGVFTPIDIFTGIFSGANYTGINYTITGLTVSGGGDNGLFGRAIGATIGDVTLVNPSISGSNNIGALIGLANSGTTLVGEIEVSGGTVTGTGSQVGGIVGYFRTSTVAQGATLTNSATVSSGGDDIGGLIGEMNRGTGGKSLFDGTGVNNGTVSGTGADSGRVGGLFGSVFPSDIGANATLTNNGDVSGTGAGVGGIIGWISLISNYLTTNPVTNTGDIVSTNIYVGGIIGNMNSGSTITNAFNSGDITGTQDVGGIIGADTAGGGAVNYAFGGGADVTLTGGIRVGGIVGAGSVDVSNAMFAGTATGTPSVGGIVGYNTGDITHVIGIGDISGGADVGALLGFNDTFFGGSLSNGLVDPDIDASGVGGGDDSGYTAPSHNSFALQSTYEDEGFVFGASGWNLTSGYYASLSFCGASCQIPIVLTPDPTPPPVPLPSVAAATYVVQAQIRNGELEDNNTEDPDELALIEAEIIRSQDTEIISSNQDINSSSMVLVPFEYLVKFTGDEFIRGAAKQVPADVRNASQVVYITPVYLSGERGIEKGEFSKPTYINLINSLNTYRKQSTFAANAKVPSLPRKK